MRIVLATEGPRLPAAQALAQPSGGVELATAMLAQAFARAGHTITVLAGAGVAETDADGVIWAPRATGPADLVIANRAPRLFRLLPRGERVLWLHNPARYLKKPRHAWPLLLARPIIVVLGPSHRATLPRLFAGRAVEIPLAVPPPFDAGGSLRGPNSNAGRANAPTLDAVGGAYAQPLNPSGGAYAPTLNSSGRANAPPGPMAVFASNPLRGLDSLLALWAGRILPAVPDATLHVFAGAGVYGDDAKLTARAAPVLERAANTPGVVLRGPQPRAELARVYSRARAMLYLGDPGETFCLAVAEAQAMGLPCVLGDEGAVPERVVSGVTGVVAPDQDRFAQAAIHLLRDNAAWSAMHQAALARGPGATWTEVAARFTALAR